MSVEVVHTLEGEEVEVISSSTNFSSINIISFIFRSTVTLATTLQSLLSEKTGKALVAL